MEYKKQPDQAGAWWVWVGSWWALHLVVDPASHASVAPALAKWVFAGPQPSPPPSAREPGWYWCRWHGPPAAAWWDGKGWSWESDGALRMNRPPIVIGARLPDPPEVTNE